MFWAIFYTDENQVTAGLPAAQRVVDRFQRQPAASHYDN